MTSFKYSKDISINNTLTNSLDIVSNLVKEVKKSGIMHIEKLSAKTLTLRQGMQWDDYIDKKKR
jgi:hypothetical protein